MSLCNINYLAVLVSAIAAFALGSLWYTALFGKIWQKEVGLSQEDISKSSMFKTMGGSFILMLIMVYGLAIFIQGHNETDLTPVQGLYTGLAIGIFFNAASMGINYLYQLKSLRLWIIDAAYQIIYLGIAGLILGAWN